jgi:hypothetical protein
MYHIWPAQCQIQLGRAERGYDTDFASCFLRSPPQSAANLAGAVCRGLAGVQYRRDHNFTMSLTFGVVFYF